MKIFFIVGMVVTVISMAALLYTYNKRRTCTAQTVGTVSISTQTLMGKEMPYPALSYVANGAEYTVPFSGDTSIAESLVPGEVKYVTVVYDPSNPKLFYLDERTKTSLIVGIVFLIGGIVLMLIGRGLPWIETQDLQTQEIALKIVFSIVGLTFAGIGSFLLWNDSHLKKVCTVSTEGIASVYYTESNKRSQRGYRTEFTYYANDEKYVGSSEITSGTIMFSEGQSVRVFYDPSNPQHFYVPEEKRTNRMAVIMLAVGAGIIILTFFAKIQL